MALRQFVVRTAPLTHEAMIVDAASRDNGRLRAIVAGKEIEIGMDTYMASGSVDLASAEKIVRAYAQQHNIPETDVMVRVRLPKTNVQPRKARKTNDVAASSLSLVKSDQDLTSIAQAMQNAHNEQKASADKPDGATIKRTEEEKKATAEGKTADGKKKRSYNRKTEEQSARSKAAMARYLKELQATSQQSPTLMQPVTAQVPKEVYEKAVQDLATKLAKLLLDNTGVL